MVKFYSDRDYLYLHPGVSQINELIKDTGINTIALATRIMQSLSSSQKTSREIQEEGLGDLYLKA